MPDNSLEQNELGKVLDVYGDQTTCILDLGTLVRLRQEGSSELARATSIGCYVKIAVGDQWLLGSISKVEAVPSDSESVIAAIDILGEGPGTADGFLANFETGVTLYPHTGDKVWLATKTDLDRVFSPENRPNIEIGYVYPTSNIRASLLYDKMLSRHFAVLGSTGSGKSTFVSLMLHKIMEVAPEGHIVVLDPHGEYASAFSSAGKVHDVENLEIPYWMMNLEEHCEAFIPESEENRDVDINVLAKCLFAARSRNDTVANLSQITADSPVPYVQGDLIEALDDEMGRLEKQAELQTYMRLKLNVEQLFSDNRYSFIFNENCRKKDMTEFLSEMLRIPSEGKPISIIDLSAAPSQIVKVIVSLLSRIILDFAMRVPRDLRSPVLLVCEEAQRYLPAVHPERAMSAERQLERIAREGRKYGVSLGLITQRPAELSETALSQCGTIIALRLTNSHDKEKIRATLPEGSLSLVDSIPALQNRECIISGEGARVPVRVRIDDAPPDIIPASDDPEFSKLWNIPQQPQEVIEKTVRRWKGEI